MSTYSQTLRSAQEILIGWADSSGEPNRDDCRYAAVLVSRELARLEINRSEDGPAGSTPEQLAAAFLTRAVSDPERRRSLIAQRARLENLQTVILAAAARDGMTHQEMLKWVATSPKWADAIKALGHELAVDPGGINGRSAAEILATGHRVGCAEAQRVRNATRPPDSIGVQHWSTGTSAQGPS